MNPIFLLVLLTLVTPLVIVSIFYKKFVPKRHLNAVIWTSIISSVVLTVTILGLTRYASTDVETLNGYVTDKHIDKFSCPTNTSNPCENGYSCHCHTVKYACGTDDKGYTKYCTREECDTCYEYPWEQNFYVGSSLQGSRAYKISRVDAQGAISPKRWLKVVPGEPVSITSRYTNYILSAVDSIFAEDGKLVEKYKDKIPAYPQNVYDYYRMDRLVVVGNVRLNNVTEWNTEISKALIELGPKRQANLVLVIAEGVDMDYANAVRRAWKGFKKNDIVVFMGVDKSGSLMWTRTMSWSKDSIVNIKIESEMLENYQNKPLDPKLIVPMIKTISLSDFNRRPMAEFEYLKNDSMTGIVLYWILGISAFILAMSILVVLNVLGLNFATVKVSIQQQYKRWKIYLRSNKNGV